MYNNDFYNNLIKPHFTPSAKVFRTVWTILYVLMAVSFLIILADYSTLKPLAVSVFIIQLVLNFLWSPVFFIAGKIKAAFYISVLLTLSVFFMVILFFNISILAGILQIPYLLWSIFAMYLNILFLRLNEKQQADL